MDITLATMTLHPLAHDHYQLDVTLTNGQHTTLSVRASEVTSTVFRLVANANDQSLPIVTVNQQTT